MRGNRKTDSSPEVRLRSALHRLGLRFRKNPMVRVMGTHVRPDIVFSRARIIVFVDGCFWHSCTRHGTLPRTNVSYWTAKLRRNQARDRYVNQLLRRDGWKVIRVWEHVPPDTAARRILKVVDAHRMYPEATSHKESEFSRAAQTHQE